MDNNTTFKYWLAVARHTSYKSASSHDQRLSEGNKCPAISTSYQSGS